MKYEIFSFSDYSTDTPITDAESKINKMAECGWTVHTFTVTPSTNSAFRAIYVVMQKEDEEESE